MSYNTKVIAIAAQKGGVGKTATTINLGVALAQMGYKVLLIDCDNHPSLSIRMGIQQPDTLEDTLASILTKTIEGQAVLASDGIIHHEEGVDFVPSSTRLANVEMALATADCRERYLAEYIEIVRGSYDYVLLDCLPSIGLIAINALTAADEVLLVTKADFDSAKGMENLLVSIKRVQRKLNPSLAISGALITMVDLRTRDANETIDMLKAAYGAHLRFFDIMISASVKAREAGKYGISIHKHAPDNSVALAYADLAKEVSGCE